MNDDKLDLSPLDPEQDEERWEALVTSITRRAVAARERRGLFGEMLTMSRPALALAAGVAIIVWMGAISMRHAEHAPSREDRVMTLLSWANAPTMPEPSEILATFGGNHDSGS